MHARLFLLLKNTPNCFFLVKSLILGKLLHCNIYIFLILICMKNTECVLQKKKFFECSNCNSVEKGNITTIKFLSTARARNSPFSVVLEFIIRIGNAKTLVSAIYMLISTFGSSFHWEWIARYYSFSYFYTYHNNKQNIKLQQNKIILDVSLFQILV